LAGGFIRAPPPPLGRPGKLIAVHHFDSLVSASLGPPWFLGDQGGHFLPILQKPLGR